VTVRVKTSEGGYDINISRGALSKAGEHFNLNRRALVVTDDGVPKVYAGTVAAQCKSPVVMTLPRGEGTKCFDSLQHLLSAMIENGFTRTDCVVAVGGGVIGDLAALAASLYMRGVDFCNIPTTLLSQVDSSIGGKTAINFKNIKNIVGTFYQPRCVIIDPDTLDTLDDRQKFAGLAESVKMAATCDAELFDLIESCTDIDASITDIIVRSLEIKRRVIEADPKESGLRKVLNFGHTIGHAIESLHEGALYHGECVALGMLPMCSDTARARLVNVLKKYGLPTEITDDTPALLPYIAHDKKAKDGGVSVVYVDAIGSFEFRTMTLDEISASLDNYRKAL
jgi:3-dehydroquinate synthase